MSDSLPSIDDFLEEELPSVDEVIKEENLPSVDEFIEKEEDEIIEEKTCGEGEYFCNDEQKCKPIPKGHKVLADGELVKESQDLTEVLQLINAVRRDIPQVPEIKYYDEELKVLAEQIERVKEGIPEIPEIRYYDDQVESICEAINLLRVDVKDLPEVKYYDEQLDGVEDRIDSLQQDIVNLPEVKYYDEEIKAICEAIDGVRAQIPTFPKWVNEVNEVPDFSWIGKTFSVIDDDFVKVGDNIKDLRDRFDADFHDLSESLDTKDFEQRVQIDEVKADIKETNEKIFKELKEAAIKIWSHHDMFKDDDRKLKKQVLSKLNETKQKIEEKILDARTKSYEENKTLSKYFEGLQKEIAALPEVKYYDNPIRELKKEVLRLDEKVVTKLDDTTLNIAELYKLVGEIKATQQQLHEGILDASPDEKIKEATDKFVTVQDLQKNYKLFVQNVQQQMAAWGDGGEVNLQYMDDITGIATNISAYDGMYLQIDTSQSAGKKFKFSSVSAGSTIWTSDGVGISTLGSVGIGTTASADYKLIVGTGNTTDTVAYFDGSISVGGTTYSREVIDIESIGIITATKGIDVLAGGIEVDAGGISVSGVTTAQQNLDVITGGIKVLAGGITVNAGVTTVTDVEADSLTVSVGLATVKDLKVGAASTFVGVGTFQDDLFVGGDLSVVGILTVGSSSITIDGSTNKVNVGTAITLDATAGTIEAYNGTAERTTKLVNPSGDADFVGIVTASSFVVGVGGTDLLSEITGKTSIGLVLALS